MKNKLSATLLPIGRISAMKSQFRGLLGPISSLGFFFGLIASVLCSTESAAQCAGVVLNISQPIPGQTGVNGTWIVPSGGPYKVKITVKGAKGGDRSGTTGIGGSGATLTGEFVLISNQTISATAGAQGPSENGNPLQSSGGSGSYSSIQGGALLAVAGGGGSGFTSFGVGQNGGPGQISQNGSNGLGVNNNGASGVGGSNGGDGGNGSNFAFISLGGKGIFNGAIGGIGTIGSNGGAGGQGGGGYSGGGGGCRDGGGGGGSYNLGTNQNNTVGANNGGGQVIIECLGPAMLSATATPTQPTCAAPTQGSVSIDLTGDLNGNTTGLEYAIVSGNTFFGTPTFLNVTADLFSVTSGIGTTTDLDGETYTVRVRLKYNPSLVVDLTYSLQHGDQVPPTITCKNATVNLDNNGAASITTANVFQSGSDNCGQVNQVSVLPNTFTCTNIGTNTVTLLVNDGHGNTANCNATVTVTDNNLACAPLPVELVAFKAIAEKEAIQLLWETASERNNAGFQIERSENGRNFEKISFVNGAGTSAEKHTYQLKDKEVRAGQIYFYRLQQLDYDGSFQYSDLVQARLSGGKLTLTVFPNPAPSNSIVQVQVQLPQASEVVLMLFDAQGSVIRTERYDLEADIQTLQMQTNDLPANTYFLKATANGLSKYQKLIVTR